MNSKLRVTILGAAVAVAAFGMGGSKCHAQGVGAGVNLDIDVNALTNTITDRRSSPPRIARAPSKGMLAQAFEQSGGATMWWSAT